VETSAANLVRAADSSETKRPLVSVIAANYNCREYLRDLLKALQRQSIAAIEIIIVDDASSDNSLEIIEEAARQDSRIVPIRRTENSGPAAARNCGLAVARGEWIAIVDSDDLVHPFRFEWLIEMAERKGADIVADNLFVFYSDNSPPSLFLSGRRAREETDVSLADYLRENHLFGKMPVLGYLKPIMRRSAIERIGLRYNEKLRIGEDYDFILRALTHGLRFSLCPLPLYCYRKREQSISHRLGDSALDAMDEADLAFLAVCAQHGEEVKREACRRYASVQRARAWGVFIAAIKERKLWKAMRTAFKKPDLLSLLQLPIRARAGRILRGVRQGRRVEAAKKPAVCVISRQPLLTADGPGTHHVLSLAKALVERGFEVQLIQPSALAFGRWPIIVPGRRAKIFSRIRVHRGISIGPALLCLSPAIWRNFIRSAAKWRLAKDDGQIPNAHSWSGKEYAFIARNAPRACKAVLFDSAFDVVAIPYLPNQAALSVVLMQNLLSSRHAQSGGFDSAGYFSATPPARASQYLSFADAVTAIEPSEAEFVRAHASSSTILCYREFLDLLAR
jgi:succinoglycan biosynthesis protein ExoO